FSAAPFTLSAYLVEGGTSRDFNVTRRFLHEDREGFEALLDRAAKALAPYLAEQARSGADALMLFDTWAGMVSAEDFATLVAPATARGVAALTEELGGTRPPTILFPGLGSAANLELAATTS